MPDDLVRLIVGLALRRPLPAVAAVARQAARVTERQGWPVPSYSRHKTDPGWAVHGLPDQLYTDHGSDFTSDHLTAAAADLHIEVVHSAVGRP